MIIIKTADIKSEIDIDVLGKIEPILWYCQGIFCVIPIQVIQNTHDIKNMYQKFPNGKTRQISAHVTRNQGIPVDPKVGYALLGEESNDQP